MSMLALFFGAIFVNNILLARFPAAAFLGVSSKLETAKGMGIAVIFVTVLAATMTWLAILSSWCRLGSSTLHSFILIIAALVQFVEIVLKKARAL